MPAKSESSIGQIIIPDQNQRGDMWVISKKPGQPIDIFLSRFRHPNGTPKTHDELGPSQSATDIFFSSLSTNINPKTGKPYTHAELGEIFHISEKQVGLRLTQLTNPNAFHAPEIVERPLPESVKSFFTGVAMGAFERHHSHWRGKDFISISTQGKDPKQKTLLRFFGPWGQIRDTNDATTVFLPAEAFAFLLNPFGDKAWTRKVLENTTAFGPFFLGFLLTKLSDKRNRVSMRDENIIRSIHNAASKQAMQIGDLHTEHRDGHDLYIFRIPNPEETFTTLFQNRGVKTLPFLPELAKEQTLR